jgi:peptidoglycan/LPS O-acetylase OafA/YrhL
MELLAPSITTTPHASSPAGVRTGSVRLPFIDNLRWVMIILVVAMHAAVTYSIPGAWYYTEPMHLRPVEQLFFYAFEFFTKTFRMGILFFLAGYFVPGAYDRKGAGGFMKDRAYRLGLPTLLFMFVLSPVTGWLGAWHHSAGEPVHSFLHEYKHYFTGGYFLSGFGPFWFCVVLLLFCGVYAAWRELGPSLERDPGASLTQYPGPSRSFPKNSTLFALIALIAGCTFLVRICCPLGTTFFNLQFGYFPQYIAFFIGGTLSWRHRWLATFPAATGRRWGLITVLGAPLVWIALLAGGNALKTAPTVYMGGWHWQSLVIAGVETVSGVGLSLGIITLFRERFNRQGPRAAFLSANYFSVYVFHAIVLVVITRAVAAWQAPALLKFAVAAPFAVALTYILSATLFRRIPLLKKIL